MFAQSLHIIGSYQITGVISLGDDFHKVLHCCILGYKFGHDFIVYQQLEVVIDTVVSAIIIFLRVHVE